MKYAVDMGSGAMIHMPGFIKLTGGGFKDSMVISYAYYTFFQNKESRLIKVLLEFYTIYTSVVLFQVAL
jgi:hypothetical protein